jgi:hypothetical protein
MPGGQPSFPSVSRSTTRFPRTKTASVAQPSSAISVHLSISLVCGRLGINRKVLKDDVEFDESNLIEHLPRAA